MAMLFDHIREAIHRKTQPELLPYEPLFADATVIMAQNVADYYFTDCPQEEWNLRTDFPNSAPPWPVAWYEYTIPHWINSEGKRWKTASAGLQLGVLMCSYLVDLANLSDEDRERGYQRAAFGIMGDHIAKTQGVQAALTFSEHVTPEMVWNELTEEKRTEWRQQCDAACHGELPYKWAVDAISLVRDPARPNIALGFRWLFPLTAQGRFVERPDGSIEIRLAALNPYSKDYLVNTPPDEISTNTALHIPCLANSFAHCKNVEAVRHDRVEQHSRKRAKRGGHVPALTYYVLKIQPMLQVVKSAGSQNGVTGSKALHIVRGHFSDYRERGLFGKLHGIFWWDMHVRGKIENGAVFKDYAIKV